MVPTSKGYVQIQWVFILIKYANLNWTSKSLRTAQTHCKGWGLAVLLTWIAEARPGCSVCVRSGSLMPSLETSPATHRFPSLGRVTQSLWFSIFLICKMGMLVPSTRSIVRERTSLHKTTHMVCSTWLVLVRNICEEKEKEWNMDPSVFKVLLKAEPLLCPKQSVF